MKTIVVGLDGGTFELIDRWIESGDLPNLKKVKEGGVWGHMEVCLPPVSSPNWKCYSTGKNPGKLGIFWWENIDCKNQRVYCPDLRSKSKEIWDYLNDGGFRTAVLNMPMTYPPKRVDGYIVAGGPSARERGFTYPKELEDKLKEKFGYRVHPRKALYAAEKRDEVAEEIYGLMDLRFKVLEELMREDDLDFIHFTITYINFLQHFYWDHEVTKRGWELIDRKIGRLMEKERYNLIFVSDHGSNKIKDVFNINSWLVKKGLLKLKQTPASDLLLRVGLNKKRALKIAKTLRINGFLERTIPKEILGFISSKDGGFQRGAKSGVIDWKKTRAIASGQGPLYLNVDEEKERAELRGRLIDELEVLRSPHSDEKVVRKVHESEEIYSGEYLDLAPDLVLDQADHVHIPGRVGEKEIFGRPEKWAGENKKVGMFAAIGPDFAEKGEVGGVTILDVAPTILHLFGLPISADMDGKVLKQAFREGSGPSRRAVKYRKAVEGKEKLRRRIKELKKIGRI